jgi:hypothetical protein
MIVLGLFKLIALADPATSSSTNGRTMSVTHDQLNDFHRFALARLGNGGAESVAELAQQWQAVRERAEVNQALREATEDLQAGRYRSAEDVLSDLERKFNLPS